MLSFTQHISKIVIENFKQYHQCAFDLHQKLNIITGKNGVGKTNLLDAIYYSCFLKSNFSSSDLLVYHFSHQAIQLNTYINIDEKIDRIKINNLKDQKKQISLNDIQIDRQTEIASRYPIIFIEPNDQEIILGTAEIRRKLIDATLSLSNPAYLTKLIEYQRIIKQKNSLLKLLQTQARIDEALLDIYNQQLITLNTYIFESRSHFLEQFNTIFKQYHKNIFDGEENVFIQYESKFINQDIKAFLIGKKQEEINAQKTLYGIHTDDITFNLNDYPAKKIASQGQQKTIVLATKLAQYEYIKLKTQKKPILFLDDIFDKLDMERIKSLLNLVYQDNFGQIFITYTDANRILSILEQLKINDYKHIVL